MPRPTRRVSSSTAPWPWWTARCRSSPWPQRRAARQAQVEPPGGACPGRRALRLRRPGCQPDRGGGGPGVAPAPGARGPGADPLHPAAAAAQLPRGSAQGHRRGPAPQPGQERDGGVTPTAPSPRLHLGLPMWANPDWRGTLYPPHGGGLEEYARVFGTVEGNTTFYSGAPRAETVAAWARQAPPDFRFCFKLPALLTHERRLAGVEAELDAFLEALSPLHDRLGPLMVQLPRDFGAEELPRLDALLARWPANLPCARRPGDARCEAALLDAGQRPSRTAEGPGRKAETPFTRAFHGGAPPGALHRPPGHGHQRRLLRGLDSAPRPVDKTGENPLADGAYPRQSPGAGAGAKAACAARRGVLPAPARGLPGRGPGGAVLSRSRPASGK